MNKHITFICTIVLSLLLNGCWDQRLLKDHSLILAIGYDLKSNNILQKTVTFPQENKDEAQQKASTNQNEVVSVSGDTAKDTDNKFDQIIPHKFDRSKARIILLGENLAQHAGVFPTFDSIYRDLRGPLDASVAIIKGEAKDALNINKTFSQLTDEFYFALLNSAEKSGLIKNQSVQSICPVLLSETTDIVLPYISVQDNSFAQIDGLALFSGDKMTGTLDVKESIMFLILSDQIANKLSLNMKISDDNEIHNKNFVDFVIRKLDRKLKIHTDNQEIRVSIDLSLNIEVTEYAMDHLYNKEVAKTLASEIEKQLTDLAENTLTKMQEFNNDSLGIGQRIKAYHHSLWDKENWKEIYPEIPIETTFNVNIVRHGIIN